MICPDCGEVAVMKKYEVYCPRCGLVLDDAYYSLEYCSRNVCSSEDHAVIPVKKKKHVSKEEKKIATVVAILKHKGKGLPSRTVEKAILIAKKGIRSGIFDRFDKIKICNAALYVAAKNDCLEVPFRLKKKERQIARILEMLLGEGADPNRKLANHMEFLVAKMLATGIFIDSDTAHRIQENAMKLVAHGCAPKNAVAAAFYVHAIRGRISVSEFSRKCGVPKATMTRLIRKLDETAINVCKKDQIQLIETAP